MSFLLPINDRLERCNHSMLSINSNMSGRSCGSSSGQAPCKKDAKFTHFDNSSPLDFASAIDAFANKNKNLYYKMLAKFVNKSLWKFLSDIKLAINKQNYTKYNQVAQTLKSQSGMIGAVFIHYDCYSI